MVQQQQVKELVELVNVQMMANAAGSTEGGSMLALIDYGRM